MLTTIEIGELMARVITPYVMAKACSRNGDNPGQLEIRMRRLTAEMRKERDFRSQLDLLEPLLRSRWKDVCIIDPYRGY